MNSRSIQTRPFTGWHMLVIMVAFFGVIISVNLLMATLANTSWTGLVVQNTYVASQQFNERIAESRAQAALGWKSILTIANGEVRYSLADATGSTIAVDGVTASFRRPAYEAEDWQVALKRNADGAFSIVTPVRDGIWIVSTEAKVAAGEPYREARRIVIADGELK
ncbi:FixH family protein [Aminobacter anthyllidis]|uniref:FixH family protein n=1 Tax=Aminobacter anthyllidis TaxID=1035067 RepID=A0A9X1AFN2_9HYPH|nr:FixH family protein [Aminobacter anthyllidis]MBT1159085.1 FixH family protein [Aminobacter anthyllidis]